MNGTDQIQQRAIIWRDGVSARLEGISMRKAAVCAGILFALSLLPLFLLGRYNVMCIDDYNYGRQIHDTWMATGSLLQSVQAAWRQNMDLYQGWQGTYISCFLMGMSPMNFRYDTAWIVPVLMIGMFAASVFVLGRHILCRWMGIERAGSAFVMFVLLFLFYQVMEAPFEGIYWYNGATHYIFMQSVWFFALAAVLAGLRTEKRAAGIRLCALSAVLMVLVGGGNLITGLQAEIVTAFLVVCAIVANRRKIAVAAVPFVAGSVSFLINIMAPGNANRGAADTDVGYPAVMSVLLSFYHALVFIIRWTPAFAILTWLALLPVLWKLAKKSDRDFGHPWLVTAGAVCLIAAMFTPTLYAVGMAGLSRVDNIIQMVYYLCLMLTTTYWLGCLSHRVGGDEEDGRTKGRVGAALGHFLEAAGMKMTAVCACLVLVVWVFTADKNTYASVSALRSLVNGEAQTFYAEAMERHALYEDETVPRVEVAPYSARPALFDFDDLSANENNWLNLAVAWYYHKEYVRCLKK